MMSPGWTHSRLRQAAEAAAVLLPRRLALAFSKSSWWRPCHEAKRPRTMGASPAVPDVSAAYCSSKVSIRAFSVTKIEAQYLCDELEGLLYKKWSIVSILEHVVHMHFITTIYTRHPRRPEISGPILILPDFRVKNCTSPKFRVKNSDFGSRARKYVQTPNF